jgi:ABC-type antimicrobial peptide transport system permease subunit
MMLLVRTTDEPAALAQIVRGLVRDEAPSVVLDSIMTMDDRVMSSLARPRTYAIVLGGFSLFALAIAGTGLFGVLSYGVAQRTREIGIRTALGGQARDIVALVLHQAFVLTAIGVGIGLTVAGVLAQFLSKILYGVPPHDIVTFCSVPTLIAIAAGLACVAPALRAARIDPLQALRSM